MNTVWKTAPSTSNRRCLGFTMISGKKKWLFMQAMGNPCSFRFYSTTERKEICLNSRAKARRFLPEAARRGWRADFGFICGPASHSGIASYLSA